MPRARTQLGSSACAAMGKVVTTVIHATPAMTAAAAASVWLAVNAISTVVAAETKLPAHQRAAAQPRSQPWHHESAHDCPGPEASKQRPVVRRAAVQLLARYEGHSAQ